MGIAQTARYYNKPVLGYLLVGNDLDSEIYVRMKKKACDSLGIEYIGHHIDNASVTQQSLIDQVKSLQDNCKISGILV